MADFPVTGRTTLERHLVRNGVQPWRIPALIQSRGVLVNREGNAVAITGPALRLEDGDLVRVVDPPSAATTTALTRAATASARDYAFIPGTSPFDLQMANVLTARPQTLRINEPLIDSLRSFIASLGKAQATAPITTAGYQIPTRSTPSESPTASASTLVAIDRTTRETPRVGSFAPLRSPFPVAPP